MQAALAVVTISLAYAIYLIRSGLGRRVQLDRIRLRALFGRRQARLGAIGIILNWFFFVVMSLLMLSGGLLYFGIFAGHDVATVHWCTTWLLLAFVALHILTHYKIGGLSQLLRICRPELLPAAPLRLDPVELLAMMAEQSARPAPKSRTLADCGRTCGQ